jgi:hypothetical protein
VEEEMMEKDFPPASSLNFESEGYQVGWSDQGLEIRTIDYHAGTLFLPWKLLLDLARASGDDRKEPAPKFRPRTRRKKGV